METILTGLITSIIGEADNIINTAFNGLMEMCFQGEVYLSSNIESEIINFNNLKA